MRAFRIRSRRWPSCRERLDSVLRVIYLVFNEGYSASSGASLTRHDLSGEAIRLGRLLVDLLPEPEAMGLLALMLLHESRRAARTSPAGELILLDEQDRSLWDRAQIAEGRALVRARAVVAACRSLRDPGGDCGRACGCSHSRGDRLGADRRTLRCAGCGSMTFTRGGIEPCRRGGDARWTCRGPGTDRRDPRARRSGRLPPGACGTCGAVPAARQDRGGPRGLRAGARSHATGLGKALYPTTPG